MPTFHVITLLLSSTRHRSSTHALSHLAENMIIAAVQCEWEKWVAYYAYCYDYGLFGYLFLPDGYMDGDSLLSDLRFKHFFLGLLLRDSAALGEVLALTRKDFLVTLVSSWCSVTAPSLCKSWIGTLSSAFLSVLLLVEALRFAGLELFFADRRLAGR